MILKTVKTGGLLSKFKGNVVDDLRQMKPLESATVKPEFIPGYGVMYHAKVRGAAGALESAWDNEAGIESAALVIHGPLFWGNVLIDPNWYEKTRFFSGGAPESVTYPAITDYAWLYVTFDLENADTAGCVSCAFQAGIANPPMDDSPGLVLRRALSLWHITTTGEGEEAVTTGSKVFDIPHPFPGNLVSLMAPPKALT